MERKVINGNEKLKLMIELLKQADGHALTTSMLMDKLGCNRNSVNNYYRRCIDAGIKVTKTNVGHETGYFLEDDEKIYEPLSADMVRKYMIMQKVRPGTDKKQDLLGFNYNNRDQAVDHLGSIGNMGASKYYHIVNELIEEGELIRIDDRYYPGRKTIPVKWFVSKNEELKYLNILAMIPPGYHSQSIVESVFEKINTVYRKRERDDEAYVVLGRPYELINRIHGLISALSTVDYINRLIKIRYAGKDMIIAVGMVVYSAEKDKLYILGERRGNGTEDKRSRNKKDLTVFLDVEKIKDIKTGKGINRSYFSKSFVDLYDRMFSVGNSRPADEDEVMVIFDNEEFIRDRLENLCAYRQKSGASLEEKGDKLIYRDRIMGMEDFLRFLRQFTGKYEMCNSGMLRERKKDSLKKMKKLYSGEAAYE